MKPLRRSDVNKKKKKARVKAESSKVDIKTILDNVSDAIISIDNDMKITSWNTAAESIYGFKKEEVLGKPIGEITRSVYFSSEETF